MTKDEIAVLGHAFFDWKVLQWRESPAGSWFNYSDAGNRCPDFNDGDEWRIKPDEPKKVMFIAWTDGDQLFWLKEGVTPKWPSTRLAELDREVTLSQEECL